MPKTSKQMIAEADATVPRVSGADAKAMLGKPGVVFVDLREPAEIAASGKVPGALAIPRGLLEFRADREAAAPDPALTGAETVVLYCASGGRAALAGKTLQDMGYTDVKNLARFQDWVEAGGEAEKG
jgi:rhodanese-related sulfurtransferase